MAIEALQILRGGAGAGAAAGAPSTPADAGTSSGSFADTLGALVDNAEATARDSNVKVSGMLDKSVDVHEAMIALQRAETSMQLTVQIRNKLVQAYQDIMRMPV